MASSGDLPNSEVVDTLIADGSLRLERGRIFDTEPTELWAATKKQEGRKGANARGPAVDWDRVEGMMLGLAIGDALGNPTEAMNPGDRRERYGEITDYMTKRRVGEKAVPSDDTQLAFWTLEQLLADDGRVVPEHLLDRFESREIFGIGSAVLEAMEKWDAGRDKGVPWWECAAHSAGNGALMRIAPVLIPHLRKPSRELWADTALAAAVTHNDRTSTSACLAFVAMLWELLAMDSAPPTEWWWQRYVEVARDLEGERREDAGGGVAPGPTLRPRGGLVLTDGAWSDPRRDGGPFEGPLWSFVEDYVPRAWQEFGTKPPTEAVLRSCDIWYSGAFLLETVPSVLFILMRCGDDPEEAIVRAVNDTKDNDTIGAIVGAAVGALHGESALPQRWVTGLKGRTSYDDDGRVVELLDEARERWGT